MGIDELKNALPNRPMGMIASDTEVINVNRLFLVILFLFFSLENLHAAEDTTICEAQALEFYFRYRAAALSSQFESNELRKFYKPISEQGIGDVDGYYFAVRIMEARISKVLSYHASCDTKYVKLNLIVKNFSPEYSRVYAKFERDENQLYVMKMNRTTPIEAEEVSSAYKEIKRK